MIIKKKMMKYWILFVTTILGNVSFGQGLEDVIVETYYIADFNDSNDTDGGSVNLPEGAVTYRIFLDLAEGYELRALFGDPNHELRIETTTLFWNNEDRGDVFGEGIQSNRLSDNTVALDSYLTFGLSSEDHFGVPKQLDFDGSIIGGINNDGGSEGVEGGLLTNYDQEMNYPLTERDGLIPGTSNSGVTGVYAEGEEPTVLDDESIGGSLVWNGSAITNLDFPTGPTDENIILVAQLTTDGELSFKLNALLFNSISEETEFVVSSTPVETNEYYYSELSFPPTVEGCTDPNACNFNTLATIDEGCLYPDGVCFFCGGTNGEELINSCSPCVCLGDFNSDDSISALDLSYFLAVYGTQCVNCDCPGDFNGDSFITNEDLFDFLNVFGGPCE